MSKPFLILQLRPETAASDDEFQAFLNKGGLAASDCRRIRLDQENIPDDLVLDNYAGIIVGGGPGCISDAPTRKSPTEARIEAAIFGLMPEITRRDFPFLGCCYGIAILAHHLGAPISKERYSETVGATSCTRLAAGADEPLLDGVPQDFRAFVGHKEAVQALPEGCVHLIGSETCPYQMIRFAKNVYATQFHPEADSAGFELRIGIYRDRGYFAPADADKLIAMCQTENVFAPEIMLRNFVRRYGANAGAADTQCG